MSKVDPSSFRNNYALNFAPANNKNSIYNQTFKEKKCSETLSFSSLQSQHSGLAVRACNTNIDNRPRAPPEPSDDKKINLIILAVLPIVPRKLLANPVTPFAQSYALSL